MTRPAYWRGGDLTKCLVFTNNPIAPPKVELDSACTPEEMAEAPEFCIITYPAVLGVDVLERPATNTPRLPPARLGLRWQNELTDHWTVNAQFTKVFTQTKLSTATIPIKPDLHIPQGCDRRDPDCEVLSYDNDKNPKVMQSRYVTENKTQGYNLVNLGVDYKNVYKGVDYTLSLRANNLLNEQIYIHNSFLPFVPQIGRNYSLALSASF